MLDCHGRLPLAAGDVKTGSVCTSVLVPGAARSQHGP